MKNEGRVNGHEWITAGEEQAGEEEVRIHNRFTLPTLQLDFNLFPPPFPLENNIF